MSELQKVKLGETVWLALRSRAPDDSAYNAGYNALLSSGAKPAGVLPVPIPTETSASADTGANAGTVIDGIGICIPVSENSSTIGGSIATETISDVGTSGTVSNGTPDPDWLHRDIGRNRAIGTRCAPDLLLQSWSPFLFVRFFAICCSSLQTEHCSW